MTLSPARRKFDTAASMPAVPEPLGPGQRKAVLGQLGRAGFTQSLRGATGGTLLARAPGEINLLDVYRAVEEPGVLGLHRSDPNPACEVGRNITRVLGGVFDRAQDAVERVIESMTLHDIVRQLKVKQATR